MFNHFCQLNGAKAWWWHCLAGLMDQEFVFQRQFRGWTTFSQAAFCQQRSKIVEILGEIEVEMCLLKTSIEAVTGFTNKVRLRNSLRLCNYACANISLDWATRIAQLFRFILQSPFVVLRNWYGRIAQLVSLYWATTFVVFCNYRYLGKTTSTYLPHQKILTGETNFKIFPCRSMLPMKFAIEPVGGSRLLHCDKGRLKNICRKVLRGRNLRECRQRAW